MRDGDVRNGHAVAGAGIVEEDVEAGDLRHAGGYGGCGCHVQSQRLDALRGERLHFRGISSSRVDVQAGIMEGNGQSGAEAAVGAAGYEDGSFGHGVWVLEAMCISEGKRCRLQVECHVWIMRKFGKARSF